MGEVFGWLFGALFGFGLFVCAIVLPIVAIVKSGRARREALELRSELAALKMQLLGIQQRVDERPRVLVQAPSPVAASPEARPERAEEPLAERPAEAPTAAPVDTPPFVEAPVAIPEALTIAAGAPASAATSDPVAADVMAARIAEASDSGPAAPPPPAPPKPTAPNVPGPSLEERIALVWFTRIGAIAMLLGVAYFFKYAVDSNWIGPLGRVALGALAGVGVLAFAELTRANTKPVWSQVTLGVGLSLLLLSAYASFAFYQLVPMPFAFGAFFIIALLGGALSIAHNAESILLFSLAAALSAPVLLSTGQDRPFALFAYLTVVTALSHAASLKMQFRWSLWVGIAGTALLFMGWYGRFFDAHAAPAYPGVDLPKEQLEGAYLHLSARTVPLAFIVVFLIEWLTVYFYARRGRERLWPVAILVAAALLAHVGFAALLYDRPIYLGGLLTVLGVLASILLHREKKAELLAIPLLASFAVLVSTVHAADQHQPVGMLLMLALWASIYLASFLRGHLTATEKPTVRTLGLIGVVGLGFAILSAALLANAHPLAFAGVLAVLSLVYGLIGVAAASPPVLGGAVGLSFAFLLANMPSTGEPNLPFIGVSAAWAAVYLGSVAYELLVKRAAPTAARLFVLSVAGIAFAFLAESHTSDAQGNLRAAIFAAVATFDLWLGSTLLRREASLRRPATVLLGQALGLYAAAVALLFTGATITVIWALLAAVVIWLAGGDRDRLWLAGGLALFAATVLRLLSIDLEAPHTLTSLYFATMGKSGELLPRFLFNPRALALAGTGAALLVAARAALRCDGGKLFSNAATALFIFGHGAFLILFVTEVHRLSLTLPAAPTGVVDANEFQAFLTAYTEALVGQRQRLAMLTTLIMGVYAGGLLGYGFSAKDRTHRYLGLGLFALTLAKLALSDVWSLERPYQILVLVGTGGLLLGSGFLYARFGRRLVAILRDGSTGAALVLIGLASLAWPARAHAFPHAALREQRPLEGVGAPGFYRVEVDPALYQRSSADSSLTDVRIAGPDGQEVPYLVRLVPVHDPPQQHAVTLVDPVTLPDGSTRAVLDLGQRGLKHSQVELDVDGSDFLRRTRVEISDDEVKWALLASGAIIYRVQSASSPASHSTLTYPTSDARYLRVTILPAPGHDGPPVQIRGARAFYFTPASRPTERFAPLKAESTEHDDKGKLTRIFYDLVEPGVPFDALSLTISTAAFERRAVVSATNFKTYWAPVGAGMLYRFTPAASTPLAESTRIELTPTRKRYLKLEISDGDDPPLAVDAAQLSYPAEELVFRTSVPGPHTLYVGSDKLGSPSYDLPSVLQRSAPVAIGEARFGAFAPNPMFGKVAEAPKPMSEQYKLPIGLGLAAIIFLLALWTVRLLRNAKRPE